MLRKKASKAIKVEKNYYLFAVTFEGTALAAIRAEYAKQIKGGQRKKLFIIDLDDADGPLNEKADIPLAPSPSVDKKKSKRKSGTSITPEMNRVKKIYQWATKAILELQIDYDDLLKDLELLRQFDLLTYWKETAPQTGSGAKKKSRLPPPVRAKASGRSLLPIKEIAKQVELKPKPTTKIGKKENLSKKIYIEDDPEPSRLYIVLIGGEEPMELYKELLSQNEPLLAIIHFTPQCSFFDTLSVKNMQKLIQLHEMVDSVGESLRKMSETKPLAIREYDLPPLSQCLTSQKYYRDIYDQLTWYLYDIDMLQRKYMDQYFMAFNEINVAIPANSVVESSLSLAMENPESAKNDCDVILEGNDITTIAFYLDCLLNSIEPSPSTVFPPTEEEVENEGEEENPNEDSSYSNAIFIVHPDLHRIILDESNDLLKFWFSYETSDIDQPENEKPKISETFSRMQKFFTVIDGNADNGQNITQKQPLCKHILPKYYEVFISNDSVYQRALQLSKEYDTCELLAIGGRYTLHHFSRRKNVVVEITRKRRLPTKLCFRDFCDYLANNFLDELEKIENQIKQDDELNRCRQLALINTEEKQIVPGMDSLNSLDSVSKFNRPNSIKARNLQLKEEQESEFIRRFSQLQGNSLITVNNKLSGQILPETHSLLSGYNLSDTLEELTEKTSTFRFNHGFCQLKTETWHNGNRTGSLQLSFNDFEIYLRSPTTIGDNESNCIESRLRLLTHNDISCYASFGENEMGKIFINWPNGLSITRIQLPYHIEQRHLNGPSNEPKRLYTLCGSIIIFYKNDELIRILKANGTIYDLYTDVEDDNRETEKTETVENEGGSKTSIAYSAKAIQRELCYLNKLCVAYDLKNFHYHLTTSNGRNFEIRNNKVISENHKYLVFEWMDYFANEWYAEREDGLRMIWTHDSLKCYFSDGTLITSKVSESTVFLECDEGEEEELGLETEIGSESIEKKPSTSSASEQICCNICDEDPTNPCSDDDDDDNNTEEEHGEHEELAECKKEEQEIDICTCDENEMTENIEGYDDKIFIAYKLQNFLMQNKCYATVSITGGDKIQIYSPDDMIVEIEEPNMSSTLDNDNVEENADNEEDGTEMAFHITIGKQLHLNLTPNDCWMQVCMQVDKVSCDLATMISFSSKLSEIFDHIVNNIIECHQNFVCNCHETKYLLSPNDRGGGFEFFSIPPETLMTENSVNCEGFSSYNWNFCKHERIFTMVKGLKTIKEKMRMPIENHQTDMNKFIRKVHQSICKNKVPEKLFVRVFLTTPRVYMEAHEIVPFLDNVDVIRLKSCQAEYAVVSFLTPLQQEMRKEKSRDKWKNKLKAHRAMMKERGRRLIYYKAMIKHKTYPIYQHFSECFNGDVRNINFDWFQRLLCGVGVSCVEEEYDEEEEEEGEIFEETLPANEESSPLQNGPCDWQQQPQQAPCGWQQQPQQAPCGWQQQQEQAPGGWQQQQEQAPCGWQQQPQQAPCGWQQQPQQEPCGWQQQPQQAPCGWQQQPQQAPCGWQQQPQQAPCGWQQQPQQAPCGWQQQPQQDPCIKAVDSNVSSLLFSQLSSDSDSESECC